MVYIVYDPSYEKHYTGPWHPEQPARVSVIHQALEKAGIVGSKNTLKPRQATEEDLLLCHTQSYIDLVKEEIQSIQHSMQTAFLSTGDAVISKHSLEIALLAAGGVLTAIDAVMKGPEKSAFCCVRPPGHHACSAQGMGFCIFNNIAIGARYAQKKYGISKVLIVDWDVHHGNGTQEIFYNDPTVFYFSTHEKGIYPYTGNVDEVGAGTILNCPIIASPRARFEVKEAFEGPLRERMESFKPELVLISAGFDAHKDDPLANFNLEEADFVQLTEYVKEIATQYAQGRVISVLEGGYNLKALASSVLMHVTHLT